MIYLKMGLAILCLLLVVDLFSVDSALVSAVSFMGFMGIIVIICAALYHF